MDTAAPTGANANSPKRRRKSAPGKKLATLPQNAKVQKRPLLRPALASPHAGPQSPKIVYVGIKTPFMSVVKRVEKLLRLSEKRLVQSASTLAYNDPRKQWKYGGQIGATAEIAEELKKTNKRRKMTGDGDAAGGEEIVVKGSGKAVPKVMQVGVWFQLRAEEYAVRLETKSVTSIDDVEYEAPVEREDRAGGRDDDTVKKAQKGEASLTEIVEETRIRKVSVLEMYVSRR